MEQRDIEIFLTLAEELHFGRTAERLHVSTARVSQTIKKLERRIGAALFERTSRRVVPTPIGRRLEEDLRPAYQQILDGIDRAVAAGRGIEGVLRVGFVGTVVGRLLQQAATRFHARHSGCEVRIADVRYSDFLDLLRADELDLVLVPVKVDEPDIACGPVLFREPVVLAVSARHRLARRASVSLEDLGAEEVLSPRGLPAYMNESLIPRRTPGGRPIRHGQEFSTVQEMLSLIGAGLGVFPVPAHASKYDTRPDIAYLPIDDGPPRERRFIWRATAETNRIRAFTQATADAIAAEGNFTL
ncbi:LysR family transcriptional regulator [Actinomadura madurae]|uniref:LysR family transcriptional regulator n=1 Tax=Actinomadura madurae TaxID=1993 RepID=UPI0020266B32|nr:LysR family transcriptional regulator [Actinomadura madurae]MCP9952654.1 LysR family transcriptional regulator [Actinomadura madurae]MCP9981879.1 LysR family transcriptional regulator [Actinomadura madurae]MCQ0006596.1 LysR family transcriptional regulator [Actinomadura madurae]MCQ0018108.1 LysR family transcriptional regulator [Actinomadura madurae]URM98167.1 LysR family transcriptional regulator [Actinomadura madurae]